MKSLLIAAAAIAALTAASPAVAFDWDGAYAGVTGGYSWAEAESGSITLNPEGWNLGVVAGYNFVLDGGIVLGIEGALDWADITDTYSLMGSTITSTTDWTAGVRGKIGFDGGDFLPYVTAGITWGHGIVTLDGIVDVEDDGLMTGASIGAGVELAVADNVTVKAEYLYTTFAENTWFEGQLYEIKDNSTSSSIRAGINFHF